MFEWYLHTWSRAAGFTTASIILTVGSLLIKKKSSILKHYINITFIYFVSVVCVVGEWVNEGVHIVYDLI